MKTLSDTIKIVGISASRGWEPGFYEVLERRNDEVKVRNLNGGKAEWIYVAHTFVGPGTMMVQKKWLAERAAKIGKK
jgi:hypothetical protein